MGHLEYQQELREDPGYQAAGRKLRPLLRLADDVVALRLQKGWSQTELARHAGTDRGSIWRLEEGLANPTYKVLQKIADALGAELIIRLRSEDEKER